MASRTDGAELPQAAEQRALILNQVEDGAGGPLSEASSPLAILRWLAREMAMKWVKGAIAVTALLAPASGQAQSGLVSQDFCIGLKRVIEAALHKGGFLDLERDRAAAPRLGFSHGCQATGDERRQYWLCNQSLAPAELSLEPLAARIAACLPEAVRGRTSLYREAVFTLPHARIHVSEHGGPRAHVGRIVELMVEAVP